MDVPTVTLPTHEDVLAARDRLAGRVVRTPMLRNALLDARTGATVLVKPEPLQRTGSFKLRGATNATLKLSPAQRAAGLVTHSSGNHGQAVACAAAALGLGATVFMPADAPAVKVESTLRWGAEIIHYDRLTEDREALSAAFAARTGATVVPPYEHPDVIAGQGTAALELAEDASAAGLTLDALLVCTGGGGLVGGSALAMEGASPGNAGDRGGAGGLGRHGALAGRRRTGRQRPGRLAAVRLAAGADPGELTFAVNQPRLAGAVAVSDAEVLDAMAFAFTHLKLVVEPGGAVALAALLSGRYPARGQVVGIVISGGNVDPAVFARALA